MGFASVPLTFRLFVGPQASIEGCMPKASQFSVKGVKAKGLSTQECVAPTLTNNF
jgi:hypothetical protein